MNKTPKHPMFTAELFTDTKWNTAQDKADFANHFVRFLQKDCPKTLFYKGFYTRLSMMFGHIANFNQRGFYEVWFSSEDKKISFLDRCSEYPSSGDPSYTYSDVERALRLWTIGAVGQGVRRAWVAKYAVDTETRELAELKALQEKYPNVRY